MYALCIAYKGICTFSTKTVLSNNMKIFLILFYSSWVLTYLS